MNGQGLRDYETMDLNMKATVLSKKSIAMFLNTFWIKIYRLK